MIQIVVCYAAINTMIYMRGNSRDYDIWESEYGAKDWRWEKVGGPFKGTDKQDIEPRCKNILAGCCYREPYSLLT